MNKQRLSNIELLRIIAMFMILTVHADYWLLGIPTLEDIRISKVSVFTRILIEQLCVVGVNVFVLITGWFGLKPTIKSFSAFIFQILFFFIGIYTIGVCCGFTQISIKGLASCFLFTPANWFIKAYIALYIVAPILNACISNTSQKQHATVILLLYIFQFIYGWTNSALWIEQGYSVLSFIALYLVARYLSIYRNETPKFLGGWQLYLISCLLSTLIGYAGCIINKPIIAGLMTSYVNPLVVIGAIGLLLAFVKLKIGYSQWINKIGKSTFAVYLFPCFFIFDFIYRELIYNIYLKYEGPIVIIMVMLILVVTFITAIIIDQLRIFIWNKIWAWREN